MRKRYPLLFINQLKSCSVMKTKVKNLMQYIIALLLCGSLFYVFLLRPIMIDFKVERDIVTVCNSIDSLHNMHYEQPDMLHTGDTLIINKAYPNADATVLMKLASVLSIQYLVDPGILPDSLVRVSSFGYDNTMDVMFPNVTGDSISTYKRLFWDSKEKNFFDNGFSYTTVGGKYMWSQASLSLRSTAIKSEILQILLEIEKMMKKR